MPDYTNIDRFNIITGLLLEEAYEEFPMHHVMEITTLESERPEVFGDECDAEEFTHTTMAWLAEEGFVRDKGSTDSYLVYTLSLKGFTALNRTPDALEQSFHQKLKGKISDGSWDAVRSIVPDLMRSALLNGIS